MSKNILTKKWFIVAYNYSSDFLHANNPFGNKKAPRSINDYFDIMNIFLKFINIIKNLLQEHYVHLLGDEFIICKMDFENDDTPPVVESYGKLSLRRDDDSK